ncbi:MAG: glucose-1-phosphate thymidylyltransferase RfbA, partial [Desulfobacterales bacterium]
FPITRGVSKQLLPVYDKPMIYYPLSVLMMAGIKEILVISTPQDLPIFERILGDGSQLGLSFAFKEQPRPEGLAQAFVIGEKFIGSDAVALILGDNIFYGPNLSTILKRAVQLKSGGLIFGYLVKDPQRYGVVNFDASGNVIGIEEKPQRPKSNYAVPGLYFYDNQVINIAKSLKPSGRGELEITDINMAYLRKGNLKVELLGRGYAWLDTGTHEALQQAASYVQAIQERQGLKIACVEEIAYRLGYISKDALENLADSMTQNDYGRYLLDLANDVE